MKKFISIVCFLLFMILMFPALAAQQVVLEWEAPTTRADGATLDPLAELAHYLLQCEQQDGDATLETQVPNEDNLYTLDASSLFTDYGDYSCHLRAVDLDGRTSEPSNAVLVSYSLQVPSPPGDLRVRIVIE